jgi:hypothetical protein
VVAAAKVNRSSNREISKTAILKVAIKAPASKVTPGTLKTIPAVRARVIRVTVIQVTRQILLRQILPRPTHPQANQT